MNSGVSNARDFDFEIGKWQVHHRRLKLRLQNCTEWEEFSGRSEMQLTLGRLGNVEHNLIDFPGGMYHAMAIRAFDQASATWAIWWLDGRNPHVVDVPVIGRFADGIGTFMASDSIGDQKVLVRFLWLATDPDNPRWEQAMSLDEGATWETNWVMNFTRA